VFAFLPKTFGAETALPFRGRCSHRRLLSCEPGH
jgi:hypothetical protein